MMTAMLTVRNILAGRRLHDVWSVNEDAEYHERGSEGEVEALRAERLVPRRAPAFEPVTLSARLARAFGADRLGYLGVSIAAVAVDFALTLQLTSMGLAPALSAALGYALGMALHWELSTRLVFSGELAEAGPHRARQAALFVASGLAGLSVTMAVYATGVAMGAAAPLAKLLAVGLSFIAVYILRRHLVFPLRT